MKNTLWIQTVCACVLVMPVANLAVAQAESETPEPTQSESQSEPNEVESGEGSQEQAALIRHLPINDSFVEEVRFVFDVTSPDYAGKIVVRVITDGSDQEAQELEARLTGTKYVAVLPAAHVVPPGFSYYVIERMADGTERPVFADASTPHRVRVTLTDTEETQAQRAQARDGIRSTVLLSGEVVDYGDRKLGVDQPRFHDRYYRLEVGYAYAFFATIEDVRLSLVRVRGQAARFDDWEMPRSTEIALGIDYGRAAVTIVVHEHIRLRGALLLGASQRGFEYGAGASILIGDPLGSNIDFGTESLTTLGTVTHLRMGFLATRHVPMGAAVEVSSFPVGEDSGVRLLYDIGYRFNPITTITLRGGYQARTSVTGGASLGLTINYGF